MQWIRVTAWQYGVVNDLVLEHSIAITESFICCFSCLFFSNRLVQVAFVEICTAAQFMDLENLASELNGLLVASERVRNLQACYSDVCAEEFMLSEVKDHLAHCRKTEEDLENERKSHAEELRQINQDINQLEDILKSLRSERETKKARLTRRIDELRVAMDQANESIRAADIINIKLEEGDGIPKELLDGPFNPSPVRPPVTSLSFLGNHFPFLPTLTMTPTSKTPAQDMSKMKNCDACGAQIHRNAPTCPICKTRSVSKNPKRARKREE